MQAQRENDANAVKAGSNITPENKHLIEGTVYRDVIFAKPIGAVSFVRDPVVKRYWFCSTLILFTIITMFIYIFVYISETY